MRVRKVFIWIGASLSIAIMGILLFAIVVTQSREQCVDLVLVAVALTAALACLVVWIRAELRGRSVVTRVRLGIATIVSSMALVWSAWWLYDGDRESWDEQELGDALSLVQDALHEGRAAEVERLLEEFDPANMPRHHRSVQDLGQKVAHLPPKEPGSTPIRNVP